MHAEGRGVSNNQSDIHLLYGILRNETETRRLLGFTDFREFTEKVKRQDMNAYLLNSGISLNHKGLVESICWDCEKLHSAVNWETVYQLKSLKVLDLSNNRLYGRLMIHKFPKRLEFVALNDNRFAGSIDLSELPAKLQVLCLQKNNLSGYIDVNSIPGTLKVLHLENNRFHGDLRRRNLPPALRAFFLDWECFQIFDDTQQSSTRPPRLERQALTFNDSDQSVFLNRLGVKLLH